MTRQAQDPSGRARAIDLAHEADFALGVLRISPSAREVSADGVCETVEPRVMQVLVCLAQARGAVVSRDDLIQSCWGGRVVGEDAINRSIAKVRKLAELKDGPSFTIETVARVGYRLNRTLPEPEAEPDTDEPAGAPTLDAVAAVAPMLVSPAAEIDIASSNRKWVWAVLGVVVLGIACAGAWWFLRPGVWKIDRFQTLVSTPQIERYPALAPNGTMIAYAAGEQPTAQSIYLRNLTQGEAVRFTHSTGDDYSPAWSPQSDRVAFLRTFPDQPCYIFVKPFPAGPEREVARCKTAERSKLAWGPDDALYLSDAPKTDANNRIVRLDLETGKRNDITHPPAPSANDMEPSVSPDGRKLAFYRDEYPKSGFYVVDLATGAQTRLTSKGRSVWGDGWTSDSSAVIISTLLPNNPGLWLYPIDGSKPRRLTFSQAEYGRVSGGPDGLAAVEVFTTRMSLVAADPGTGSTNTLLLQNSDILDLSIAPDGSMTYVAFVPGGVALMVKRPKENPHTLTTEKQLMNPHWSRDGKRIAFAVGDGKRSKIDVIGADGAGQTTIVDMPADNQASAPVWGPGDQYILFSANDGHGWRIWRVNVGSRQKPAPIPGDGWYSVQFDGDQLYATRFDKPGIWKLGDAPIQIVSNPPPDYWGDWGIGGGMLAYADFGTPTTPKIIVHPLNGDPEKTLDAPGMRATLGGSTLAVDPRTGIPVYIRDLGDIDIAIVHLSKKR